MKSLGAQNSNPSYSNNFKFNRVGNMVDLNVVDGLIIGLLMIFIIVGACLVAPAYFTTHFVLNLIKSAKSAPARNSLNQAENQDLNGRLEVL